MNRKELEAFAKEAAKGMTTREIQATFKDMYDADVSPKLISKVTESVIDEVIV